MSNWSTETRHPPSYSDDDSSDDDYSSDDSDWFIPTIREPLDSLGRRRRRRRGGMLPRRRLIREEVYEPRRRRSIIYNDNSRNNFYINGNRWIAVPYISPCKLLWPWSWPCNTSRRSSGYLRRRRVDDDSWDRLERENMTRRIYYQ